MSALLDALLVAAIVANGLLAGLFFVFTCAITPGFRRVDDATYVHAFRAINRAILNGWFLFVFFAAPLAATLVTVLHIKHGPPGSPLWAAAGAICAVLTFLITTARNVPLNNKLDRAAIGTLPEHRAARQSFESRWNRWNLARTITSTGALANLAVVGVLG